MATTNTKLKDFLAETGFVSKVGWSRNPIPLFGPCLAAYTMWICGQNVSMEFDRRNPRLGPCAMDHGWKPDLLYRKRCMKRRTFILRRLFAIPCLGFATVMPEAMPALASEPEGGDWCVRPRNPPTPAGICELGRAGSRMRTCGIRFRDRAPAGIGPPDLYGFGKGHGRASDTVHQDHSAQNRLRHNDLSRGGIWA